MTMTYPRRPLHRITPEEHAAEEARVARLLEDERRCRHCGVEFPADDTRRQRYHRACLDQSLYERGYLRGEDAQTAEVADDARLRAAAEDGEETARPTGGWF